MTHQEASAEMPCVCVHACWHTRVVSERNGHEGVVVLAVEAGGLRGQVRMRTLDDILT